MICIFSAKVRRIRRFLVERVGWVERSETHQAAGHLGWTCLRVTGMSSQGGLSAGIECTVTVMPLCSGKPLAKCTRNDGRLLVKHFRDDFRAKHGGEMKDASVHKKLVGLCAAVNFAIEENRLPNTLVNPFGGIVSKDHGSERRLPLDAADIENCKANLHKLNDLDRKLFALLACTGMRPGEAFEIDREESENGVRFVTVGTKTKQSLRRVPLPDFVPPIKGKLFPREDKYRSPKRLNAFLRDIGIAEANKVLYSLRHRAKDRLRAAGCPWDVAEEIFGRDKVTVGKGYGHGSPVTLLKSWVDKIGF